MHIFRMVFRDIEDTEGDELFLKSEHKRMIKPIIRRFEKWFKDNGQALSPFLAIRLEELIVAWMVARRLEEALRKEGACRWKENDGNRECVGAHPLVDAAGKARERVRKVLKDLEDNSGSSAKDAENTQEGLAEQVAPLLKLSEGVIEEAMAFERKKQEKAKPVKAKATGGSKRGKLD